MNYELAKELKEAGFPQRQEGGLFTNFPEQGAYTPAYEALYVPTLEELIEACVTKLDHEFKLVHAPAGWSAGLYLYSTQETFAQVLNFPIPSEAVARLWLALNNK